MQRRNRELKKVIAIYFATLAAGLLFSFPEAFAQSKDSSFAALDGGTVTNVKKKQKVDNSFHSPRKAALYSATFPGLGQVYNRKYWKVPIVYAGYATLGYFVYFNNKHYVSYRDAYIDFTDNNPATTSYYSIISKDVDPRTYDKEVYPNAYNQSNYDWMKEQLQSGMQYYKRNRDLSLIGIAGWYILTILDAVVDAQLFHFDVNPNLSVQVLPAVRPVPGLQAAGGITCGITF